MDEIAEQELQPSDVVSLRSPFDIDDDARDWRRAWTGHDPLGQYLNEPSVDLPINAHSRFYDANYVVNRAKWLGRVGGAWGDPAFISLRGAYSGSSVVDSYKAALRAFSIVAVYHGHTIDAVVPSGTIEYKISLPVETVAPAPSAQQRARFAALVNEWLDETSASSDLTDKVLHPAYQRIIGMGPIAITLVLEELQRTPGHWFWALGALAPDSENPANDTVSLEDARAAWLNWGREKGYLPESL